MKPKHKEKDYMKNIKSVKGVPDLRRSNDELKRKQTKGMREAMHKYHAEKKKDADLLLEIARESSLEFSDDQISYVTIQMDKTTWAKLQARASRT